MSIIGNNSLAALRQFRHQEDADYWETKRSYEGKTERFTCLICRQIHHELYPIALCTLRHVSEAATGAMKRAGSLIPYEVKLRRRIIVVMEKGIGKDSGKPKFKKARRRANLWPPCIVCDLRCTVCGLSVPPNSSLH